MTEVVQRQGHGYYQNDYKTPAENLLFKNQPLEYGCYDHLGAVEFRKINMKKREKFFPRLHTCTRTPDTCIAKPCQDCTCANQERLASLESPSRPVEQALTSPHWRKSSSASG